VDKIEYVNGVPRWFTRLHHRMTVRRCHKLGHQLSFYRSCDHCGQLLR
jgi:primosomal protein N'